MSRRALTIALAAALSLTASVTSASDVLPVPDERTPELYVNVGIANGVPYRILYAVALAESGKTVDGEFIAWPWTLNFAGNPARYQSREEAKMALAEAIAEGHRNIDIGPSQINWRWNGDLIADWDDLLDPRKNLETATLVLLREMQACEAKGVLSWWCAVGRYHSPGPSEAQRIRAQNYVSRVRRIYENLS